MARGVLLDATGRPVKGGLQIVTGSDEPPVGRCLVPGCGATFGAGEVGAWQRHVGPCARAHLDRIQEVMRPKGAAILTEDFDPEITKHMRGVGERMLREGRLEVKPEERAGF